MSELLADDALVALLHFLPASKKGEAKFSADRETIHRAVFSLQQEDPEALRSIGFRKRYLFPESASLDQALANLEATGLLQRKNETPRFYFVLGGVHEAFQAWVERHIKESGIKPERFEHLAVTFAQLAK